MIAQHARRRDRPPATVIGQVRDIHGRAWAVRAWSATAHGFAIARGWPRDNVPGPGNPGAGAPRVVLTEALATYLRATPRWIDIRLPIGKNAVGRFRRELGLGYFEQRDRWWRAHRAELREIGARRFARKYALSEAIARQRWR